MLNTYFAQSPIPLNEPAEGVEVSVEADLGSTKLIGIIDLVVQADASSNSRPPARLRTRRRRSTCTSGNAPATR